MDNFKITIYDLETKELLTTEIMNFIPRCGDYINTWFYKNDTSHYFKIKAVLINEGLSQNIYVDINDEFEM